MAYVPPYRPVPIDDGRRRRLPPNGNHIRAQIGRLVGERVEIDKGFGLSQLKPEGDPVFYDPQGPAADQWLVEAAWMADFFDGKDVLGS